MNLSAMQIYAIMLLQDLRHSPDPVGKPALSKALGISLQHVQQVAIPLMEAGLVASRKGPGGGYLLADRSHRVTVLEVVQAAPETLRPVQAGRRFRELRETIGSRLDEGLARMRVDDL